MIPSDFADRRQYLHARETLSELVGMGVLPIINENDALSNDQLRYGDNDLLAALVCNLFAADLLLLLTDQEGIFSADPRLNAEATLIQEISDLGSVDADVGESGSMWGSGGMASKLKAARMAAHSGVQTVIAGARVRDVVDRVVQGGERLGTLIRPYGERLPARKLWIAFAASPVASVAVDHGARMAVERQGRSLLVAGVLALDGPFSSGEIVTVRDVGGEIFAKGIVRRDSSELAIPVGEPPISDGLEMVEAGRSVRRDGELIHRDDLVVLTR
jgi:glutamate 5-kinase